MIVWLASYPRSGNSLLRQILFQTMGYKSHHEGSEATEISANYATRIEGSPAAFYRRAARSAKPVFVKTHLPPEDDSPALYVVRDGRSAITSFLRYERHFSAGSPSTALLPLIAGHHHYGSWSDHYRVWHERKAPILTLRYEQLFAADAETLQAIADFVGFEGTPESYENRIATWRKTVPALVGAGDTAWEPDAEWDFVCDAAFWHTHGALMDELGLDDGRRVEPPSSEVVDPLAEVVRVLEMLAREGRNLRRERVAKEVVIQRLKREVSSRKRELGRLKAALDETADRTTPADAEELERLGRERDVQAAAAVERLDALEKANADLAALGSQLEELGAERGELTRVAQERLRAMARIERERDLQAEAAVGRLAALERANEELASLRSQLEALSAERDTVARAAEERAAVVDRLEAERDLQAEAAGERLAALEEARKELAGVVAQLEALAGERDALGRVAEERLAAMRALEAERDLQERTAAERLDELRAVSRESELRLLALEELNALREEQSQR